jgi:hypothetical protein
MMGYDPISWKRCDLTSVVFQNDRIYKHMTMQVSYLAYDLRRDEDMIHIGTPQCNIMLLNDAWVSSSKEPPYLYARVLGVFHANVSFAGLLPEEQADHTYRRIDFIWVRWYDSLSHGEEFKLDRLSLQALGVEGALDFLDPSFVLRALHVIPRFSSGRLNTLTPPSELVNENQLWHEYYINRYGFLLKFPKDK